jgi:hypothetical protein
MTGALTAKGAWIRWLVLINLALVAVQAVSAGMLLSGSGIAIVIHARVALALGVGALIQAISAIVLWARGGVPAWVARGGIVLLLIVVLQIGAGRTKRYWLHVPIAVALFGGLMRQSSKLNALWRVAGATPRS